MQNTTQIFTPGMTKHPESPVSPGAFESQCDNCHEPLNGQTHLILIDGEAVVCGDCWLRFNIQVIKTLDEIEERMEAKVSELEKLLGKALRDLRDSAQWN